MKLFRFLLFSICLLVCGSSFSQGFTVRLEEKEGSGGDDPPCCRLCFDVTVSVCSDEDIAPGFLDDYAVHLESDTGGEIENPSTWEFRAVGHSGQSQSHDPTNGYCYDMSMEICYPDDIVCPRGSECGFSEDVTFSVLSNDGVCVGDVLDPDSTNSCEVEVTLGSICCLVEFGRNTHDIMQLESIEWIRENEETLLLIPNPVNEFLTINGIIEGDRVSIFSHIGQKIYSESFAIGNRNVSIDCSSFDSGLLIVQIVNNGEIRSSTKIMKF